MANKLKKVGVFTSGGDSPGMNAAIRAAVRTLLYHGVEVEGIMHGYEGMINGEFIRMNAHSVANIIHKGGTILKTSRSQRFQTEAGMKLAYDNLLKHGINGLVAIGGDGTFRGANALGERFGIPIVGVPGTIDNDLIGTDFTIGYDTAINTVIEAVDKIRDTAESHDRLFFVEVMGRDAGLIALRSGIGSGAEAILMPERDTDLDILVNQFNSIKRKKSSKIIIVAEGDVAGGAFEVAKKVTSRMEGVDARVVILGHIQRGGSPSCMDRVNASRLGFEAANALIAGNKGVMVGIINKEITFTPFLMATKHIQELNPSLLKMLEVLSL